MLQESALFFVEHHLPQISQQEAFDETIWGSPDLADVSTTVSKTNLPNEVAVIGR